MGNAGGAVADVTSLSFEFSLRKKQLEEERPLHPPLLSSNPRCASLHRFIVCTRSDEGSQQETSSAR